MSLQFTCYIRFSSEKPQTASTITKRFNSRKKSLDGFSPVGQLTCKLFIEFTSCGGRWKKKKLSLFLIKGNVLQTAGDCGFVGAIISNPWIWDGCRLTTAMLVLWATIVWDKEIKGDHARTLSSASLPQQPQGQVFANQTTQRWPSNSTGRCPPLIIHH